MDFGFLYITVPVQWFLLTQSKVTALYPVRWLYHLQLVSQWLWLSIFYCPSPYNSKRQFKPQEIPKEWYHWPWIHDPTSLLQIFSKYDIGILLTISVAFIGRDLMWKFMPTSQFVISGGMLFFLVKDVLRLNHEIYADLFLWETYCHVWPILLPHTCGFFLLFFSLFNGTDYPFPKSPRQGDLSGPSI